MPTYCAWCTPHRKISDEPEGIISHGLCYSHFKVLKLQVENAKLSRGRDTRHTRQVFGDPLRGSQD